MEKFCVFCGKQPQEKNREHVIPRWLIEMTGDPKRIVRFGVMSEQPFRIREFSFDSLVFPACTGCNTRFGVLEERVKKIVPELLAHKPVGTDELIALLDWLDKIRVGLWLGFLYLDKNSTGINPSFHIESRLGRSDRMVSKINTNDQGDGLSFLGPMFKAYQLSPTSFALRINQLWLVNAAGISLCSQRLGFPYLEPLHFKEDQQLEVEPKRGSERAMLPIERRPTITPSVSIYQPVFRWFVDQKHDEFLEGQWLAARTANRDSGYGKLFLEHQNSVEMYPQAASDLWVPAGVWTRYEALRDLPAYIHRRIYDDYQKGLRLVKSKQKRKEMRNGGIMANMLDRALLKNASESLKKEQG
jgi:hypothetical protein